MNPPLRFLKAAADLFVYGNLLIATGAASLCWATGILLGEEVREEVTALVFTATLFVYNFDRVIMLRSIAGVKSERHIWLAGHARLLVALILLSGIATAALLFTLAVKEILYLAHLGLLSMLYSIPFFRYKGGWRDLRSIPMLKIFLITYVWGAVTAVLPALDLGYSALNKDVILVFLERCLFIFAATLPFDIRDWRADEKTGVVTIPRIIGAGNAKWLAAACALVFIALSAVHYYDRIWVVFARAIAGAVLLTLITFASERRHEYYFTAAIDGTLIFQALILYLLYLNAN